MSFHHGMSMCSFLFLRFALSSACLICLVRNHCRVGLVLKSCEQTEALTVYVASLEAGDTASVVHREGSISAQLGALGHALSLSGDGDGAGWHEAHGATIMAAYLIAGVASRSPVWDAVAQLRLPVILFLFLGGALSSYRLLGPFLRPVAAIVYLLALGVGSFALLPFQPGLRRDVHAVDLTVRRSLVMVSEANVQFAQWTDDSGLGHAAR